MQTVRQFFVLTVMLFTCSPSIIHGTESEVRDPECAICLNPLIGKRRITVMPCVHIFHANCWKRIIPKNKCPLCRGEGTTQPSTFFGEPMREVTSVVVNLLGVQTIRKKLSEYRPSDAIGTIIELMIDSCDYGFSEAEAKAQQALQSKADEILHLQDHLQDQQKKYLRKKSVMEWQLASQAAEIERLKREKFFLSTQNSVRMQQMEYQAAYVTHLRRYTFFLEQQNSCLQKKVAESMSSRKGRKIR